MSVGSLSQGPCCETGKLIVQVVGKAYPNSQKLVLTSADGTHIYKAHREILESTLFSSVLEVWDQLDGTQLHLEIETTDGEPIRLPLLSETRITPRQADAQFNQLVPILPFVALPGSKSLYDLGTPVLARAGYVYVFYRHALWRELEVRVCETGTTYHDVNVSHYRQDGCFRSGERKASGVSLDDIWLPAAWDNQRVRDLQLCFSEIQLSGPRLERLEKDAELREQRCKKPDLICSKKRFTDLYAGRPDGQSMLKAFIGFDGADPATQHLVAPIQAARLNLELAAFPVSIASPQRSRQPGYEQLLDHPASYLCDLSGQFPVNALEQADVFLSEAATGHFIGDTQHLELTAVADALLAKLSKNDSTPTDTTTLWKDQGSVMDVLSAARQRQVCGVLLDDSSYRLRHLRQRVDTHQHLLGLCSRHVLQYPHHASALLVHQLIIPRAIRGEVNPLHEAISSLTQNGRQAINQCTATVQRTTTWRAMLTAQHAMLETLKKSVTVQTLADHLSLDGFDYVASLYDLSRTLTVLALKPSSVDPLSPAGDIVDAVTGLGLWEAGVSQGQQWLCTVANDVESPLHVMLWPEVDIPKVCAPYEPPVKDRNIGDGRFRATELARFEHFPVPDPLVQTTLDATTLANLLAGDSLQNFFLINAGKATTAALVSIFENLQAAVDNAESAVDTARQAVASSKANLNTTYADKQSVSNAMLNSDDTLNPTARRINVTRQGRGVQQLRSMMPEHFGAAFLIKRNQVTSKHYVFGLEDLPSRSSMPKARYGEYLDPQGNPFRDIDPPITPRGPLSDGEHMVLVIPRGHKTAQIVGDVNRRLKAAQEAGHTARDAEQAYTRARSGLSQAIDQLDANKNNAAYRVLASTRFCVAVLMLEAWNVSSEIDAREQTSREKDDYRARAGIMAAGLDLVIAIEALAIKIAETKYSTPLTRKVLLQISEQVSNRLLTPSLARALTKQITARILAQFASAILLTVLNLWDAWYAWQRNDDAMYGHIFISMGGAASLLGTAFGGMSTFMRLNILGWVALLLIGLGIGVIILLSSAPLKSWLKSGPFGEENADDYFLKDPSEALYRLLSLLAGISINIEKNPAYEPQAKLSFLAKTPHTVRSADTIIRIQSRLPGLIGGLESLDINADCRLCTVLTESSREGIPYNTHMDVGDKALLPKAQRLYPEKLELFFTSPPNPTNPIGSKSSLHYKWAVRAQFIIITPEEQRVFPAPLISDPTKYSHNHSKPDFKKVNQPFWADETTYKATNQ